MTDGSSGGGVSDSSMPSAALRFSNADISALAVREDAAFDVLEVFEAFEAAGVRESVRRRV